MRIVVDDLDSEVVQHLLQLHHDSMHQASPPGSVHALAGNSLRSPEVTVWTAWEGDDLLGVGALRVEAGADEGEVKSMRTHPDHLGAGVGRALLRTIMADASTRGLRRLLLETGTSESFIPAHGLYVSEGFHPCGPFGDYVEDPFSCYFALELVKASDEGPAATARVPAGS